MSDDSDDRIALPVSAALRMRATPTKAERKRVRLLLFALAALGLRDGRPLHATRDAVRQEMDVTAPTLRAAVRAAVEAAVIDDPGPDERLGVLTWSYAA